MGRSNRSFLQPSVRCMFRIMVPDFLRFAPVPLRAQHNGWTPALQLRFIVALARGEGPDLAARSIGKTRQSVYRLRKKAGAESFAAAWDAAQAFARGLSRVKHSPTAGFGGIETLLVPRHYRGRLIGFVQREDTAGAMRVLGRLDRLAARLGESEELRAVSERLEELGLFDDEKLQKRQDAPANASSLSILERGERRLDGGPDRSPPCTRTREGS